MKPRCLLVDPNRDSAAMLSGIVRSHGFETRVIEEPFAALRDLRTTQYDLVIFELSQPHGDARFVLDELRRDLPEVIRRTVVVATNPIVSSDVTAGVPVVGKSDLEPLKRYLTLPDQA